MMLSSVSLDQLHMRLNKSVTAVHVMSSVLQAIATESCETEIVALAEQALSDPTVRSVLSSDY
jgi:hypothetical protein